MARGHAVIGYVDELLMLVGAFVFFSGSAVIGAAIAVFGFALHSMMGGGTEAHKITSLIAPPRHN